MARIPRGVVQLPSRDASGIGKLAHESALAGLAKTIHQDDRRVGKRGLQR